MGEGSPAGNSGKRWDEKADVELAVRSGLVFRPSTLEEEADMEAANKAPELVLGLDVGDRSSRYCLMTRARRVVSNGSIASEPAKLRPFLQGLKRCRVVLEAGTHSSWMAALAKDVGHEVAVANPRKLPALTASSRKTDRIDASLLARFGVADVDLLHPIEHRPAEAQVAMNLLRSRDRLVAVRSKLISHVRGSVKVFGARLKSCDPEAFTRKALWGIPKILRPGLVPVMRAIQAVNLQIKKLDARIEETSRSRFPQTQLLRQVHGVGPLSSLVTVLTIGDPGRFKTSRQVGAYFGLVPKKRQSGDSDPHLRITKEGPTFARRLAVSAANYILGP